MDVPIYYTSAIQYGIFMAIVAVIIGYVDKKKKVMNLGWVIMMVVGLFGLFLVLPVSGLDPGNAKEGAQSIEFKIWFLGLQAILLGVAALFSMLTIKKKKIGNILAILTVLFAMSLFFQSYNLGRYKQPPVENIDQ